MCHSLSLYPFLKQSRSFIFYPCCCLQDFAPGKPLKAVIKKADGSIGVVVGTAAVAGKGIDYKSLGLVVIDEEQRFGAADKARLKGGGDAHLLVMTATPIPRTLQAALVGLQRMSVLATPPARRQPVRTVVAPERRNSPRSAVAAIQAAEPPSSIRTPRPPARMISPSALRW